MWLGLVPPSWMQRAGALPVPLTPQVEGNSLVHPSAAKSKLALHERGFFTGDR